jgi:hypothetical protein
LRFSRRLPSAGLVMPSDFLPQSSTPLQSITGHACRTHQPTGPTALMGFVPLRRLRQSGAHYPRVCLTRYVALSGFLSLLAPCFSRRLPALFHAGNALGVLPSRAFPPRQAGTPSRGPMPSCRWPPRTARLQGLWPGAGPLSERAIFQASPQPAALLGFHPLQGLPLPRVRAPTGPSSHGLVRNRFTVSFANDLQSLDPRENWLDSLESADPRGVSRLIVLPTHPKDFPQQLPTPLHPE